MDAAEPPALIVPAEPVDLGPSARGGRIFRLDQRGSALHPWTPGQPPATWAVGSLPVTYSIGLPRSRDLGDAEDAEVDVALRSWNAVACTAFRGKVGGTTQGPGGDDGVSGIYWHDTDWPSSFVAGALAQTLIYVDKNGHIYDADVHVNGKDFVWSLDGKAGTVDARSILTHELGHALGLGHSADTRATMYATHVAGLAWRSLEADDEDGVCSLYPGVGDTAGCDALPCPSGLLCVARRCERPGARTEVCAPCERVTGACEGAGDEARCLDLPGGGRVCGRACKVDPECGAGFHCLPTTTSGDLQCVADDGCKSGPFACTKDVQCPDASHCMSGACLGDVVGPDAGVDGGGDAGAVPSVSGGGCTVHGSGEPATSWPWFAAVLALFVRRRTR